MGKSLLNAKTFWGKKRKTSWTSFNHLCVVLICLRSKETFFCELRASKPALFSCMVLIWILWRVSWHISTPSLINPATPTGPPPLTRRGRYRETQSLLRGNKTCPQWNVSWILSQHQGCVGTSKHLSIPALRKHWGLSGERNHGIFMFFASYLTSPLGRQPLVSLLWERTGQAVQDPSSQPGLTYPMDGTLPGPLSWHQFPHLSGKRLEDFSISAQLLLLSDAVSDWILPLTSHWSLTSIIPGF